MARLDLFSRLLGRHARVFTFNFLLKILFAIRELAFQIAEQVKAFSHNANTSVSVIVGGIGK